MINMKYLDHLETNEMKVDYLKCIIRRNIVYSNDVIYYMIIQKMDLSKKAHKKLVMKLDYYLYESLKCAELINYLMR